MAGVETGQIEWACPRCAAPPNKHGRGECKDRFARGSSCPGFICECDSSLEDFERSEREDHGLVFTNLCPTAHCFHCGWSGDFPVKPRGLASWEKKALDAGWSPPAERRREIVAASKGKMKK